MSLARQHLQTTLHASHRPMCEASLVSVMVMVVREGSTTRILVVDDHPEVHLALEEVLQGVHLDSAFNGQEAIALVDGHDAVIMDVQMPVLNGLEATARIREQHPDLPIIILTSSDADIEAARDAGANDYLVKPIGIEELGIVVQEALERLEVRV